MGRRATITIEIVRAFLEEKGYVLLSNEYTRSSDKNLLIWCGKEGHEPYYTRWNDIKTGYGCRQCAIEENANRKRHSYEHVKNIIESNGDMLISDNYVNNLTDLEIKCGKWNNIYKAPFGRYQDKTYGCCCYCANNKKVTYEECKEELEKFNYSLLTKEEDYVNGSTKILIMCDKGHTYEQRLSIFKRMHRCPHCKHSKGESLIKYYLSKYNIKFDEQKKYKNLKGVNNGLLSYDFYLPQYNLLIEFQGEYHDGTARNSTEKTLTKQQEQDKRKREYAINNNIKLLEIWYWDIENIEQILIKELNL